MKILTAVDFSEATDKVIAQGKSLARAFSAQLTLLHVAEPSPEPGLMAYEPDPLFGGGGGLELDPEAIRAAVAERYRHEHDRLQQISQAIRGEGVDCVALLVQGKSADVILAESEKHGADLIVIGTHGRGVTAQLLLGSTSKAVLHKSSIPVLVVPTRKQD